MAFRIVTAKFSRLHSPSQSMKEPCFHMGLKQKSLSVGSGHLHCGSQKEILSQKFPWFPRPPASPSPRDLPQRGTHDLYARGASAPLRQCQHWGSQGPGWQEFCPPRGSAPSPLGHSQKTGFFHFNPSPLLGTGTQAMPGLQPCGHLGEAQSRCGFFCTSLVMRLPFSQSSVGWPG